MYQPRPLTEEPWKSLSERWIQRDLDRYKKNMKIFLSQSSEAAKMQRKEKLL